MSHYLFLFSMLFFATFTAQSQPAKGSLRVMTYNIRLDIASDGENQWQYRAERVVGLIRYHQPDLLGVQEALPNQVQELAEALPQYAWYGAGRDDGKEKGEYSAIFYNKARFALQDSGTFWLSPNPYKPSKGWDAAYPRVCSWVKLKDQQTGREFYHFNTHFDHEGVQARENSALLLQEKVKAIAGTAPVVLTGDFNTTENSRAFILLTRNSPLADARQLSQSGHYGPLGTFSTFDVAHEMGKLIDFIFVTEHFQVLQHAILSDAQGGRYPSDHLPVIAVLALKGEK